jgi:hypothetical protein
MPIYAVSVQPVLGFLTSKKDTKLKKSRYAALNLVCTHEHFGPPIASTEGFSGLQLPG